MLKRDKSVTVIVRVKQNSSKVNVFCRGGDTEIVGNKGPFTLQKGFGTARIKMVRVPKTIVRLG